MINAFSQDHTISSLDIGIRGLMRRHEIIAANIANAGTPNYMAKEVAFEESLAKIQRKLRYGTEMELSSTDSEHFTITPNSILEAKVAISEPENDFITNGNNLDLDREMLDLSKTGMKYKAISSMGKRFFEHLQMIIRG